MTKRNEKNSGIMFNRRKGEILMEAQKNNWIQKRGACYNIQNKK